MYTHKEAVEIILQKHTCNIYFSQLCSLCYSGILLLCVAASFKVDRYSCSVLDEKRFIEKRHPSASQITHGVSWTCKVTKGSLRIIYH